MGEASPRPSRSGASVPLVLSVAGGTRQSVGRPAVWQGADRRRILSPVRLRLHGPGQTPSADRSGRPARHARQTYWCGVWLAAGTSSTPIAPATSLAMPMIPSTPPPAPGRRPGSPARTTCTSAWAAAWMAEQDVTARATIPREVDGSIGGEVLFTPAGRTSLWVLLSESAGGHPHRGEDSATPAPCPAHRPDQHRGRNHAPIHRQRRPCRPPPAPAGKQSSEAISAVPSGRAPAGLT